MDLSGIFNFLFFCFLHFSLHVGVNFSHHFLLFFLSPSLSCTADVLGTVGSLVQVENDLEAELLALYLGRKRDAVVCTTNAAAAAYFEERRRNHVKVMVRLGFGLVLL